MSMSNKKILILIVMFFTIAIPQAHAFWGVAVKTISAVSKNVMVLSDDEIIRLSKLSDEIHGTKKVGKELGKRNLPDDVLEDVYIRIAIHQKKMTREAAEGMFSRLSGTPGFRTTMRKIIGNSDIKSAGHLNELKIADVASQNGFKVLGIGEKFSDGRKKGVTDIDVLLEKGGKLFAIEAKSYASTTKILIDKFRGDLDTLVAYKKMKGNNVVPTFTITNRPKDLQYLKLLQHEAEKRDVQLIFGMPQAQIEQIKILRAIL